MAETLWLCRHGERRDTVDPDWATGADRPHDPPLTDHGRWQSEQVGTRLETTGIDAIYASPFLRAVETASSIADRLSLPVYLEDGLCEHLNHDWFEAAPEVLSRATLAREFDPVSLDHGSVVDPTFPETGAEAAERAAEAARRLLEREQEGDRELLLVGHGLTVGGVATGLTEADRIDTPLCGLCRLERTEAGWKVMESADTEHLR
jgi:broad specificity phosphatase PhoE